MNAVADQLYTDMSFSTAFSQVLPEEKRIDKPSNSIAEEYPKEGG